MLVLGLNAYHGDSSACLMLDGRVVAAVEEERFNRVKHWAGFPGRAIESCLQQTGAAVEDLDVVAVNRNPRAALLRKALYLVTRRPSTRLVSDRVKNALAWQSISDALAGCFPGSRLRARIVFVEHHAAHAASAFLVSRFDRAAVITVDGFGDFTSTMLAVGEGSTVRSLRRVYFPMSLGVLYQAVTQHLGFRNYGDEYKVMGLAPYGSADFLAQMRQLAPDADHELFQLDLSYFLHPRQQLGYAWLNEAPAVGRMFSAKADELLGPCRDPSDALEDRHRALARSVQARYEEIFLRMVREVCASTGAPDLCIAGGCAANSVANGKVITDGGVRAAYIPPSAGDGGGAVGAAAVAWTRLTGRRPEPMLTADLGPSFGDEYVRRLVESRRAELAAAQVDVRPVADDEQLCAATAELISQGLVVGWHKGRTEWGPRALGNRSILCDPRRADMKDLLNRKIKRRESFRPFAPSVLREAVAEYFEVDADVPFMSQVHVVKPQRRAQIPAVVHVDGTGRLQTVSRDLNPTYWRLIDDFRRLTGTPAVLNTSFNENEPIVNAPEEALDCFLRTEMDALVVGRYLFRRPSALRAVSRSGAAVALGIAS